MPDSGFVAGATSDPNHRYDLSELASSDDRPSRPFRPIHKPYHFSEAGKSEEHRHASVTGLLDLVFPPHHDFQMTPKNVCKSISPVPSQLHACSESRTVAFSHYTPSFSYCGREPQVFFSPEIDILYFGPRPGYMAANSQLQSFLLTIDQAHLANIQRIAIDDAVFRTETSDSLTQPTSRPTSNTLGNPHYSSVQAVSNTVEVLHKILARMPALKEVLFIPQGGYYAPGTSLDDVRETLKDQIQMAINKVCRRPGGRLAHGGLHWTILDYPVSSSMLNSRCSVELTGTPIIADATPQPPEAIPPVMGWPHNWYWRLAPPEGPQDYGADGIYNCPTYVVTRMGTNVPNASWDMV